MRLTRLDRSRQRFRVLLLVLLLIAAACGGEQEDESGAEADDPVGRAQAVEVGTDAAVMIGLAVEPETLDLTANSATAIPQVLLYNVYETLVRLQPDGSIAPLLAESWELSDDGLTYAFTLRDDVTFHNGDAMTSEDVVFSLNNVIENDKHPFHGTFAPIKEVAAVDATTVAISLVRPSASLLFFLTQGQGAVLNQATIGSIGDNPVGTGPYRFESWMVGESIVLVANDGYWGDPPLEASVAFRYFPDPETLADAMLADELDIMAGIEVPELLAPFEADDRFEVRAGLTYSEVTLSLNGRRPPLDDLRVRQAISHATDRQAIVDRAYAGYGRTIGTFSTPLDPWFRDLTAVHPHDPALARELLAEAGVEAQSLEMVLPPVSYASRSGEVIAEQLAEVGIEVNITTVEWDVWLEDVFVNHAYDLSVLAHAEPFDLAQYGDPNYYWGDDSPAVAPLLAEAEATTDETARNELYSEVLEEITAQAADHWLFMLPTLSVTRTGVTGYQADLPGTIELATLTVDR